VEPEFIEARHEERPVGTVGTVQGDERPGDIVEIETADSFLLPGEQFGAKRAETLEKGAAQAFGVDEMFGDQKAHRGIKFSQRGVGRCPAIGGGNPDFGYIGFAEQGLIDIHRCDRFEEGDDHLCAQSALRFLGDRLHLLLQPRVLGGEARLSALEFVEQAVGTLPCRQRLFALVQSFDKRLGLQVEDTRRDQDTFDVGEDARMLEKTVVGARGDERHLMLVGHLRHIRLGREELVKERIDGREMDPGGPHDKPQLVGCAL
jgi:hypothetical protein